MENTNKMPEINTAAFPHVYARVAGLACIVVILLGIFSVSYVDSYIIVPGNDASTVNNIITNEFRFRLSVVSEIMM